VKIIICIIVIKVNRTEIKINLDVLIKIGENRILIGGIKEGISKIFGNLLRFKLLMINIHVER